jgi:hypothetical protein
MTGIVFAVHSFNVASYGLSIPWKSHFEVSCEEDFSRTIRLSKRSGAEKENPEINPGCETEFRWVSPRCSHMTRNQPRLTCLLAQPNIRRQ